MFEVSHVTKRYGKVVANDDISFSVADGQIAVLLGPNGAGKSTVIKCITGLLRFDGSITVCGFPNKSLEAKRLLGYVPEMPAVYDLSPSPSIWSSSPAPTPFPTGKSGRTLSFPALNCSIKKTSWGRSFPKGCSRS